VTDTPLTVAIVVAAAAVLVAFYRHRRHGKTSVRITIERTREEDPP